MADKSPPAALDTLREPYTTETIVADQSNTVVPDEAGIIAEAKVVETRMATQTEDSQDDSVSSLSELSDIAIDHEMLDEFEAISNADYSEQNEYAEAEEGEADDDGEDDSVPLPDSLDVSLRIELLGSVYAVIEGAVVIQPIPLSFSSGNSTLDLGSVLVLADRRVLGKVFDVFGPVTSPLYSLRRPKVKVTAGDGIFYVPTQSKMVIPALLNDRGVDAEQDEEFSDDEAELEYRRRRREQML